MLGLSGAVAPLNSRDIEGIVGLGLTAPLTTRLSAALSTGAVLQAGGLLLQDPTLSAPLLLVDTSPWVARISPGLTLPLGNAVPTLGGSPAATSSVDPWLEAEVVGGSLWMLVARAETRAPLYAGSDGVRQGAFGRADLQLARRLGGRAVAWAGLSPAGQRDNDLGAGGSGELSAVAGGQWNLSQHTALSAHVRLPLTATEYPVAIGLGLRQATGSRKK